MTDERRYHEDEIAEIFESAATPAPPNERALNSEEGLTLTELQAIGREVGVSPERIADAASELDRRRTVMPRRTELGLPIGVNRSFELPRAPTDHEWELLVAELRATFGARGKATSEGNLRDWRNSNLHAYIEPTVSGYRLRMRTVKGNALMTNRIGAAMLLFGLVMVVIELLFVGGIPDEIIWGVLGAGLLGVNAIRLPGWAREREEQMEHIGSRAQALLQGQEDKQPLP